MTRNITFLVSPEHTVPPQTLVHTAIPPSHPHTMPSAHAPPELALRTLIRPFCAGLTACSGLRARFDESRALLHIISQRFGTQRQPFLARTSNTPAGPASAIRRAPVAFDPGTQLRATVLTPFCTPGHTSHSSNILLHLAIHEHRPPSAADVVR